VTGRSSARMLITNLDTHTASYVSVAELAAYWDVTRQLVYKHIQSGSLPAIRLGPRCFRVRTRDAVEFERRFSSRSGSGGGSPSGNRRTVPMQLLRQPRNAPASKEVSFAPAPQRSEADGGTGD
jgi:excisionase family DNA binding protein